LTCREPVLRLPTRSARHTNTASCSPHGTAGRRTWPRGRQHVHEVIAAVL